MLSPWNAAFFLNVILVGVFAKEGHFQEGHYIKERSKYFSIGRDVFIVFFQGVLKIFHA